MQVNDGSFRIIDTACWLRGTHLVRDYVEFVRAIIGNDVNLGASFLFTKWFPEFPLCEVNTGKQ